MSQPENRNQTAMSNHHITTILDTPTRLATLLATLTDSLLQNANPTPLGRWTANHYISRSTPSTLDDKSPPSHHHLLALSQYSGRAFAYIAPPTQPASQPSSTPQSAQSTQTTQPATQSPAASTPPQQQQASQGSTGSTAQSAPHQPLQPTKPTGPIITLPSSDAEQLQMLLAARFGALWMPRPGIHIVGSAWELGDAVVRLGELRQMAGGGGAGGQQGGALKGVVVAIEIKDGGADAGEGPEEARFNMVREMVKEIRGFMGLEGEQYKAREILGAGEDGGEIRLWCEALRLRS
jgi:hypothetical protein